MTETVLAATVNLSGGTALTFFFPVGVFVVIGTVLYLLFSRPHRRVPPWPISAAGGTLPPDPTTALAAAEVAGLSAAPGAGTTESHLEPQAAPVAVSVAASSEDAGDGETTVDDSAADDAAAGGTAAVDKAIGDTGAQE